jgi:lipopolysaccharide export system protein LptA
MTPHFRPSIALRALAWSLAAGLLLSGAARAELADREKPMHVEADALRHDDAQLVSIFTGNVVITKGTITMRADRAEVRQDAAGNQYGVLIGSPEKLAFFRQKREGLDEWIEGEGEKIEYDGRTETVVITGQAVMRRYRGTFLNDQSSGSQITYSGQTEVYTVKGGEGSKTASNPSGRVRAMLTPIQKDAQGNPLPPPTAQPADEPARLKPSTRVEEKRK